MHGGAAPKFYMRVVRFYKTALSRQIGEAVRIRRRGGEGSILNSRAEFDRCKIPRLVVEEQEQETVNAVEEQERLETQETQELLDEQMKDWGSKKIREREQLDKAVRSQISRITGRSSVLKREHDSRKGGARRKKMKYQKEDEAARAP